MNLTREIYREGGGGRSLLNVASETTTRPSLRVCKIGSF